MQDYLSKDIGLGIQGVALKSGALKKLKEDQEMFMDVMNRSMPPGIDAKLKERMEMPSGFKMGYKPYPGQNNGNGSANRGNVGHGMLNHLSKAEIYARMGIDPSKELEIDWDQVNETGTAKNRIELADKMFHVLQKEKEKVEYKMGILNSRLKGDEEETPVQATGQKGIAPGYQNNRPNTTQNQTKRAPGSKSGTKRPQSGRPTSATNNSTYTSGKSQVDDQAMFDSMPHGEMPWTHLGPARADYALHYGLHPNKLPYEDEVDMMHEERDRYQEVNHWYSSLEKPNADNVEVLKQLNHDRLQQLSKIYQEKKAQEALGLQQDQNFQDSGVKKSKVEILHRSNKEVNKEKQEYKDKFKRYLHNKEKHKQQQRSHSPDEYKGVDFDRYQCTSPNPKYVSKNNIVPYKDNM
jgi:hypothetical protein